MKPIDRIKPYIKRIIITFVLAFILYLIISFFIIDLSALKVLRYLLLLVLSVIFVWGAVTFSALSEYYSTPITRIIFVVLGALIIGFFLHFKSDFTISKAITISLVVPFMIVGFIIGLHQLFIVFRLYKEEKKEKKTQK